MKKLDHIGVYVRSIEASKGIYERFGYTIERIVTLEDPLGAARCRFAFIPIAEGVDLELIQAPAALDNGMEPLHHICFEVEDIGARSCNGSRMTASRSATPTPRPWRRGPPDRLPRARRRRRCAESSWPKSSKVAWSGHRERPAAMRRGEAIGRLTGSMSREHMLTFDMWATPWESGR